MAGGTTTTTVGSKLAGMAIQTSLLGQPIPIGWGRAKLSCNVIDYLNWKPIAHTTTTSTGGKGGSSTTSNTDYTYSADVIMAICDAGLSGIIGINTVWKDAAKYTGPTCLSQAGLSVQLGSSTQLPWSYLVTAAPSHALAYRNLAYVYAQAYDLGSSGVVANHSFEVDFAIQFNNAGAVYDANPKDIVTDFLTNSDHGVPSWPSSVNGDWSNYSDYCVANGLLLSPVIDTQTTGSDFLRQLMQETNSDCFFSEGLLKIVPLGDASATGNGVTWNPDLTPIYDLTETDFIGEVTLDIADQSNAFNYIQIEYLDRTNEYNTAVTIAYDLDNVVQFGRRQQQPQSFHDICDPQVARNVAQLWLQRNLYVRDTYSFVLPQDFAALECRDYVTLTTTVDGMLLDRQLVSILSIDEGEEGGQEVFNITAEGVPGHTASAAEYASHIATGFAPDYNVDPGNIATPFLFNLPDSLSTSVTSLEVGAAVSGTNSNWGGCFVWVSFDGTDYSRVGQIKGPARYGVLSASLASHADPDSTNTLSVDLSISDGALGTVSTTAADKDATLCLIKDAGSYELISYATATLTSANHYDLTYLRRGQFGSPIGAHSSGISFARLDDAIFFLAFDNSKLGQTVHVKFQSYNAYGRATQDLSTVTDYTITLAKQGAVPDEPQNLRLASGTSTWTGATLDVLCDAANRATSYQFDFYKADGTTLVRSIVSASPNCSYLFSQASLDGAQREYKIAVTAKNDSGSSATTSQIDVTNSAPAALTGVSTSSSTATTGIVSATASGDPDLAGYIVVFSSTSGFNPSTSGVAVTSGSPTIPLYGLAAGTYYARIAAYDPWIRDPALLNMSAEVSFTLSTGGGTASGSGTGDDGFGGTCVVDTVLILMANETLDGPGIEQPAHRCKAGDYVWTRHEHSLEWGAYRIEAISFHDAFAYCASGYPDATPNHRFFIEGRGWVRMEAIGMPLGLRTVTKMTVSEAHTYVSAGVLSHNIKRFP